MLEDNKVDVYACTQLIDNRLENNGYQEESKHQTEDPH